MVIETLSNSCRTSDASAENAALDAFRELFGLPIDLWLHDGRSWQRVVASGQQFEYPELSSPPAEWNCSSIDQPVAKELRNGLLLVGMPLKSSYNGDFDDVGNLVAWGTVKTTPATLAAALMRSANHRKSAEATVAELRSGVDPHLEQICRDFEELTWLRELQEHLFECNIDDSLEEVANRILPTLRELIAAECIALVAGQDLQPGVMQVCWCGPQLLDNSACFALVEFLKSRQEADRPVIVNHMNRIDVRPEIDGVLSCLLIPVVHRGIGYGWLVAMNRSAEHARYQTLEKSEFANSVQNEFGTGDASLLFSAAATLASHARSSQLFHEKEQLLIGIIKAMINALDAKDTYTCGHSDRVAATARKIGERMGLPLRECELLYMSGLLHDIGKIGIPDSVLLKPGRLTDEEFAVIAQHPGIGYAILSHLPQLSSVLPGVLYHHEHLDGRGYPEGLKGNEIPIFGRILAVADAYDAMTTCRPYRSAMPAEKAQSILREGSGTQWDPAVVEAFFATLPTMTTNAVHDQNDLSTMYEAVTAAGLASFNERTDISRRIVGTWNAGVAAKPQSL